MLAPLQPYSEDDQQLLKPRNLDHDPDWSITGWTDVVRLRKWSSDWIKLEQNDGISGYIHLTQRLIRC